MTLLFLRTLLLYGAVIFGLRLTGKRQLGELSTSEFAVTILISELAAIPLQDAAVPLVNGLIPLATLAALEILLSVCSCKSRGARQLLCGNPCIVIQDGKLDEEMLKQLRLSTDELLEELRTAGVTRISDVRYGIVETGGQLSIIQKAEAQPLTPADLHLHPQEVGLPLIVISNGTVLHSNLKVLNKTEQWLLRRCEEQGISSLSDVFLFTLDDAGNVYIQKKQCRNGGRT